MSKPSIASPWIWRRKLFPCVAACLSPRATGVEGKTVLVCIDGGRLRERRTKHGPKPEGRKRQGYHADWKEPLQFVIQTVDQDGKISRKSTPFYDASLGGIDTAFELLETYLRELEIATADRVVFCCDGARSYWKRIEPLAQKLKIPVHYEVIDHTHAKQNLYEIIDKLPILTPSKEKNGSSTTGSIACGKVILTISEEKLKNISPPQRDAKKRLISSTATSPETEGQ